MGGFGMPAVAIKKAIREYGPRSAGISMTPSESTVPNLLTGIAMN